MHPRILAIEKEERELLTRLLALSREKEEIRTETERTEQIDLSVFKDETRRLLIEFLKVPDRILSHEDIRQDVMFLRDDEDNVDESGVTERQIIDRARKALKEQNSRYDIKNLRKRGYKLIDRETLQTLHDPPKKPGKKRRKFCNVCNV